MSKPVRNSYFEDQEKYTKMYGDKTIVFYQIGTFYEAYCTDTDGYTNLAELEPLLDVHFIERKRDPEKTKKDRYACPSQFGINCISAKKKIAKLVSHGYTIVLFDQVGSNNDGPIERALTNVYTSTAFLLDDNVMDSVYIMTIFLEEEQQLKNTKTLLAVGMTLVDISTGNSVVYEIYSDVYDENLGLDEITRIIQSCNLAEIILYYKPDDNSKIALGKITRYLELDGRTNAKIYTYHDKSSSDPIGLLTKDSFNINIQNTFFSDVYGMNKKAAVGKSQSAIEKLSLATLPYVRISLMMAIKYILEHNTILVRNISYPTIYSRHKHLIIGNNAIGQLNIIDSNNLSNHNDNCKSVFDVVNKTCTPMGRRFLKESLSNPLSQERKNEIIKRYNTIEKLLADNLYVQIRTHLTNICDVEKLQRKMAIGTITPYEFWKLDKYYQETRSIITIIAKKEAYTLNHDYVESYLAYTKEYESYYYIDRLKEHHNFKEFEESIFPPGIYPKIDKLQDKIEYTVALINETRTAIEKLITDNTDKDIVNVESNDRDGYYFTVIKSNEQIFKKKLASAKQLIVNVNGKKLVITKNNIKYKQLLRGRTKIFITDITDVGVDLASNKTKLTSRIKTVFVNSIQGLYDRYKSTLKYICSFIAEIDFLVSGATAADKYSYCRPVVTHDKKSPSYVSAKKLRHAIVERLCHDVEYVPNDIDIGNIPDSNDTNGILLYGVNSCGKSTLMKSVGVAVILAQIGYYVPAQRFHYEPYMSLYARITGNDNILKGLSSFTLEMTELDSILTRVEQNGENTIILGDEVCRGTEDISGVALVASSLVTLSECNSTFIFSTHLHELPGLAEIKRLKNMKLYHLRVDYDQDNDCVIFDRKLTLGQGPRVYGLTVAKYLIKNKKFVNRAEHIKNKMITKPTTSIPLKKSKYNRKLIVSSCAICMYVPANDNEKELECHHINFQKDCLDNGKIIAKPYLTKNELYNLVVLCRKCHTFVHSGKITIRKYIDSMTGPILDYTINDIDCLLI